MKKISLLTVILFAIFAFVTISSSVVSAQTSQGWVCPAGYTCTPIVVPVVPNCPAGYICEPINVNKPSPSPTPTSFPPLPITPPSITQPCLSLSNNLKIGDISNDVNLLHDFLIAKGYSFPNINSGANPKNYFGIETLNAVMKYQRSVGVYDTGFVGPLTRGVINASCNNNSSSKIVDIQVLSPNGNEKFNLGQKIKITWKSNKIDKIESIQIRDVNESRQSALQLYVVASNISNTGSYEWTIPYDLFDQKNLFSNSTRIGGRNFKIYIQGYCATCSSEAGVYSVTDMSDEPFTINPTLTPSPTITPIATPTAPKVSINSPKQGETWSVGESKTISWNYQNFDSATYGNKYVDVILVPSNGREPVKLGTNMSAPYNSIPVKIYEKTSDGRSAWLPGNYKVRVVCQTTNAAGFNSCYSESGSFNVISPTPSPSATVGATVR